MVSLCAVGGQNVEANPCEGKGVALKRLGLFDICNKEMGLKTNEFENLLDAYEARLFQMLFRSGL